MDHDASPEPANGSLYFASTQIQSRYEEQEHHDVQVSRIHRFKNAVKSPQAAAARPVHVTKPKPKVKAKKKKKNSQNPRQITSISAFVRETLGNGGSGRQSPDTQTILDQFMGDQKRLDAFLDEVALATAKQTPHLLSKRKRVQAPTLFSEEEWKRFLEKLRLRFPNLTKGNRKTLKTISRRLEDLKSAERAEEAENSADSTQKVWSQASRQPSVDLSTEDLKWLYDLDEEHLDSDPGNYHNEELPKSPFCLTLSQAVNDPTRPAGFDVSSENEENSESDEDSQLPGAETVYSQESSPIVVKDHTFSLHSDTLDPNLSTYIEDSEAEVEPLSHAEFVSLLAAGDSRCGHSVGSENTLPRKSPFFRQPNDSEQFSVTTSLVFASPRKDASRKLRKVTSQPESGNSSPIKYPSQSPVRYNQLHQKQAIASSSPDRFSSVRTAALHTPSCLRVDSSPLSHKQQIDSSPLFRKPSAGSQSPGRGFFGTATTDDDVFLTARASVPRDTQDSPFDLSGPEESESLEISPLKRHKRPRALKREFLEVEGPVELDPAKSARIQLKVIHSDARPPSDDVIPDSEEDQGDELSLIEITKNDLDPDRSGLTSVLQVPSSPENNNPTKPWAFEI